MAKVIEIFAGPNGSGKTTISEIVLRGRKNAIFFNSDRIAGGLAPIANDAVQFEAGRFMIENILNAINNEESFAFETTFSGKLWHSHLKNAKTKGYRVIIYFVFVESINVSLKRIKQRVLSGGHDVPAKIVKRRFERTFDNLKQLYLPLADEWFLIDNSNSKGKVVAEFKKEKLTIFNAKKYKEVFK
jgi:predicted ABC-type ATPase